MELLKKAQWSMNKKIIRLLVMYLVLSCGHSQTMEVNTLAVYEFSGHGLGVSESKIVSDRIRGQIINAQAYKVVEREMMDKILEEQHLQLSGFIDESSYLVEVGRLLAVQYIVGGSVSRFGEMFTIEARIINVESGEIVKSVSEDHVGTLENMLIKTTQLITAGLCSGERRYTPVSRLGNSDLMINSLPGGAEIYVNDKPIGEVTPYNISGLEDGKYKITAKLNNMEAIKETELEPFSRETISLFLRPLEYVIRFGSEPVSANVMINGQSIGKTPVDYSVTNPNEEYIIQVFREDFASISDTVSSFSSARIARRHYKLAPSGQLKIRYSNELGISLDGKIAKTPGKSPLSNHRAFDNPTELAIKNLSIGRHRLTLFSKGKKPFTQEFEISMEKRRFEAKGVIKVESQPGFEITINGQNILNLVNSMRYVDNDEGREYWILNSLMPGRYTITVKGREKFQPYSKSVDLSESNSFQLIQPILRDREHILYLTSNYEANGTITSTSNSFDIHHFRIFEDDTAKVALKHGEYQIQARAKKRKRIEKLITIEGATNIHSKLVFQD